VKRLQFWTVVVFGMVILAASVRTWADQAGERAGTSAENSAKYQSSYRFVRCRHGWEPCRRLLARSFDVPLSSIGPLELPAPFDVENVIVTTPKRPGLSASFGIVTRGGHGHPMIDVELRDDPSTKRKCAHETVANDGGQLCTFVVHHSVNLLSYERGRLRVDVVPDLDHPASEETARDIWLPALLAVRTAVEPLASSR
jgi:hypothetical protein